MRARWIPLVVLLVLVVASVLWWPTGPGGDTGALGVESATSAPTAAVGSAAATRPSESRAAASRGDAAATAGGAAAPWVVRGRTVRGADQPLAQAQVQARVFLGTKAEGTTWREDALVSDRDGALAWPLPAPDAIWCLELRGAGERITSYPETFVVAPGDAPPPPFDLWILPLDGEVRGQVLDPDDKPVVGAKVGSKDLRTDAEGRFALPVTRGKDASVQVQASGFVMARESVPLDAATGVGTVVIHLRRAFRIRGQVRDQDGQPVAGATVRTFYTLYADAAHSGADGRYELDNLDPSLKEHDLFARKEGFVEASAQVATRGDAVEQDLVLLPGVAVTGRVLGPHGEPVRAATVFIGFSPSAYDRLDTVSDAAGRFSFPCVKAGEQTLNVERRGLAGKRHKFTVPKAPAPAVELEVQMDAGHFIGGRVTDAAGKPIAGVRVAPRLGGEYLDGLRSTSDADGRFRLEGVPAEGLSLEFYARRVVRQEVKVPAVDRDDLVVRMEGTGRFAGTVVDGTTGKPLAQFRIRFGQPRVQAGEQQASGYSASWLRGGHVFRDVRGVFTVEEECRIGSVMALEASADGYAPAVDDHVVATAEPDPAAVVFRLFPGATITGVVRERSSGRAVTGAKLRAFHPGRPPMPHEPNDDEGRPIAESDGSGAFELRNVGAGPIAIAVAHPLFLPHTHGPIAVAPGSAVPPQVVELDDGVTVTVLVRDAGGAPQAGTGVRLQALAGGESQEHGTDAEGRAAFGRVAPGDYELIHVQHIGDRSIWACRRFVRVARADRSIELRPRDGTAVLRGTVTAKEPLPTDLVLYVFPKESAKAEEDAFRGRAVPVVDGRFEVRDLPAAALALMASANAGTSQWIGRADVTTVADAVTEASVTVQKVEMGRR